MAVELTLTSETGCLSNNPFLIDDFCHARDGAVGDVGTWAAVG